MNDNGDQDFGYNLPSGSIGDTIWLDMNADGIQDASELTNPPAIVNGLTVTLLDGTGNPIDSDPNTAGIQPTTTTTSSTGYYLFDELIPGTYTVAFELPTDYYVSEQHSSLSTGTGTTTSGNTDDSDFNPTATST